MPRAILFDLDGTLVDTRTASWELFAETNAAFALGVDSREAFFRCFDGNFWESLAKLCPDAQKFAAAKAHFMKALRERYAPALIPGMVDVVHALAPHCTLAVISTNGIEAIRRILVGAGIATCFSHVFSGDVEPKKADSIRRFLSDRRYAVQRMCAPEHVDGDRPVLQAEEVVLVTDTAGDVAEAMHAGVRAIGVSWGMHTEEKLMQAGAERVALWPQELIAWLRDAGADAVSCPVPNGSAAKNGSAAAACVCALPPGANGSAASAGSGAAPRAGAACACRDPAANPTPTVASAGVDRAIASNATSASPSMSASTGAAATALRREHRLQSRVASAQTFAARRRAERASARQEELLQALRRIVGGASA